MWSGEAANETFTLSKPQVWGVYRCLSICALNDVLLVSFVFACVCVLFSSFKKFPFKHKRKGSGGLGGASAYVKVAQWGWGRRMMDEARGREEEEEGSTLMAVEV